MSNQCYLRHRRCQIRHFWCRICGISDTTDTNQTTLIQPMNCKSLLSLTVKDTISKMMYIVSKAKKSPIVHFKLDLGFKLDLALGLERRGPVRAEQRTKIEVKIISYNCPLNMDFVDCSFQLLVFCLWALLTDFGSWFNSFISICLASVASVVSFQSINICVPESVHCAVNTWLLA